MADETKPITATSFTNASNAPFVYFDGAPAYGTIGGAIEIELTSRTLVPTFTGGELSVEIFPVARLRCSPSAAAALIESLTKALALAKQLAEQAGAAPAAAASRLN